jgi:phage-related protein
MNKSQAHSSIKSLAHEMSNLTPSAMVTLFEIDLSDILDAASQPSLQAEAANMGFPGAVDKILRFHNNIKVFNSKIIWNGEDYWPVPIQGSGFETSSKGALPTPTLTIASQSSEAVTLLTLLKHSILKFGDIIGAKVTRRRTFAKYLDWENFDFNTIIRSNPRDRVFSPRMQELPEGYEPDPNAELPQDIYYIERKTSENKNTLQYQLSSSLDLEGVKIPRRVIISDRCNWEYRGPGCWYECVNKSEIEDGKQGVPVLQKAQLSTHQITLPDHAPPVATDNDELIKSITGNTAGYKGSVLDEWDRDQQATNSTGGIIKDVSYSKDEVVYIIKDKIKYYFVAKGDVPLATPPPNSDYWIADECSKTLRGCRLRWGVNGQAATGGGCLIGGDAGRDENSKAGGLPFGGFPAARKVARGG